MPIEDMFWGDRFGQVTDPFGHGWQIATHKEDLTRRGDRGAQQGGDGRHELTRFVGRANVRKRLGPLEGEPGRTAYADGAVRIEAPGETITVRPPFGLAHAREYERVELAPLFEALDEDHLVAALLVRLGGYAVGVFEGEKLVASKVGSRFVKGKHKKGGSSASRFRRRREEQARALIEEAAEVAASVLEPWRAPGRVRRARRRPQGDRRGAEVATARLVTREGAAALLRRSGSATAGARAPAVRALCGRAHDDGCLGAWRGD